jgi:uncharacterized cofD-like protein
MFEPFAPVPRPRLVGPAPREERSTFPRIVAIGGGTGLPSVLEGLCGQAAKAGPIETDTITAVVTVTDDGGSSGKLRSEFGVLPPGDVRNCLAAIADADSPYRQLLQHRLGDAAHPVGNLLLTALTQITGNFPEAVNQLAQMIGLRGRVLPTTGEDVRLRAEMDSGQIVTGETTLSRSGCRSGGCRSIRVRGRFRKSFARSSTPTPSSLVRGASIRARFQISWWKGSRRRSRA